jgi:hypothetical protein
MDERRRICGVGVPGLREFFKGFERRADIIYGSVGPENRRKNDQKGLAKLLAEGLIEEIQSRGSLPICGAKRIAHAPFA